MTHVTKLDRVVSSLQCLIAFVLALKARDTFRFRNANRTAAGGGPAIFVTHKNNRSSL